MDYVSLPTSNLKISRIILGTWPLGGTFWGEYNEKQALQTIEFALEKGITTVDTAPVYGDGQAERLLGQIIKNKREKVIIATKGGLNLKKNYAKDLSQEHLEKDLNQSLKRLQTDYIDLYQCHWPDPQTPIYKTMEALRRFKDQGKIKHIGVSNFNLDQIKEAVQEAPIATLQSHYSLLERKIEGPIQDFCIKHKISLLSYGSLGGGVLTGKYQKRPQFSKRDVRSFFYPFYKEKNWSQTETLVELLKRIGAKKKAKPSQIALAWLLARKGITAIIVGAKNPAQLSETIISPEIFLSPEEITELDLASQKIYEKQ